MLAFTVIALLLILAAVILRAAFRRGRASLRAYIGAARLSRGHCPKCDHGFAGKLHTYCVDCGYQLTPAEFERLARVWQVLQRSESDSP